MSIVKCDHCEKLEDTNYNEGEWIRDQYICETCVDNVDEDELDDIRDRGR